MVQSEAINKHEVIDENEAIDGSEAILKVYIIILARECWVL
jgi:hypothetical protein